MGNPYRKPNPPNDGARPFRSAGRRGQLKTGAAKSDNNKRLSVQYKAGEEQPDNVFFPCNRPPHLEELHIQAQAGLKSLQNQEKHKQTKRAWDQSDANSIQSSRSSAEGDDLSIRSKTPSCTTENSEDALSVRSEMIQRKGSTFRPHDSFPKSSMKGEKRRRERRTTVLGLPQHVQKELGLSNGYDSKKRPGSIAVRASPSPQPPANRAELSGNTIHIPTVDGKLEPTAVPEGGARVSLPTLELEGADCALQRHINRIYYDDSLLGRKTAAKLSPLARPKSLAVPWMTTQPGSPELLRPVMSISPQGTYLSKIIPNAILPPMVDVIALTRDRVCTLSRCSLATASPASVRSLGRFPSGPRSREHSSSSDNWSHSQSTETIVSNTSTISSHGGTNSQKTSEAGQDGKGRSGARPDLDQLSAYSSVSRASSGRIKAASASPNLLRPPGSSGRASPAYSTSSMADGSDTTSVRSDHSTSRSVSLRKMKKPPAPPRRTYSLSQKAQQLEASGAPKSMGLPPKPERRPPREGSEGWAAARLGSPSLAGEDDVFSPSSQSEASSLACSADLSHGGPLPTDSQQELPAKQGSPDHFGRTMSPSSGYSSQSGTPTLHTKGLLSHASSPRSKRPQPKKPERVCSLQSPGLSVSSSLTSLSSSASDPPRAESPPSGAAPAPNKVDRFIIPPHPKVPAPFSPPPSKPQQAELSTADNPPRTSPSAGKAELEPPVLSKPISRSPPPSPPPAYHPPPPPVKKVSLGPEVPSASETEPDAPQDVQWPPPPPPVPDEHDLSMADFPPPDEAYFSSLPLPEAQPAVAETPPAEAQETPPAVQLLANQRAASAEKCKEPTPSPSFSTKVSSKIQQQGVLGAASLPAPTREPPPKLPAAGEASGSQFSHRKAAASVPAAPQPSGLQTQPSLKKLAGGPRPDLKKEPASRNKSNPMPKEDASLPIVTPSLLQMVRLRSINMDAHSPVTSPAAARSPVEQNTDDAKPPQAAPQKPIRKSLSLKGPPAGSKEASPSNPLHNAVRSKASTLSSRDAIGLGMAERKARNRLTMPAPSTAATAAAGDTKEGQLSPLHKSPASTASFIFAKSSKKLVIETSSSPEAQANLKKNLVAELMNVSGQRPAAAPGLNQQGSGKLQAQKKPQKIPPPIAKKPLLAPGHLPSSPQSPKPPGVEELSSSLPAVGDRTKSAVTENQASLGEAGRKSPPAGPEMLLQSPPAQGLWEETA
ncbi:NHS-like protein 3 isoform X2 [Paroedura picta]|uniref:NHS-like protein 3 isoform X2 n=1 Tax=Paroedura picta TaxID=143630 RepID=UPI00405710B2